MSTSTARLGQDPMVGIAPNESLERCGKAGIHLLLRDLLVLIVLLSLPSCSRLVSMAANDLTENLAQAIADSDDPATVEAGGPAYLLMLDGMIRSDPENPALLEKAAALYSTYAAAFVADPLRTRKLADKAMDYAERGLCARRQADCDLRQTDFAQFEARLQALTVSEVPRFFTLGAAWAGWIQAHQDDLNAVAELPRVEAIMTRIVALDEGYMQGSAHLYLGTFAILVPPALGGRPEIAEEHFERAIALSGGTNLMAKVVYAERYARMLYDRPLHDRLLEEVLAADPDIPGLVLQNTLAQQRARRLLADADTFF